jgi:hypothetical protein
MENESPQLFFSILRILDCGFIFEEAIQADISDMKIGHGMNFFFDIDNEFIDYLVRIDFIDAKTGLTFISGTVKTMFSIRDFRKFVDSDKKVQFPKGSLEAMFSISYHHLRAILAKNLGGTKFSNVYAPIVNPHDLFHTLLQENIEKIKNAPTVSVNDNLKKETPKEMENIVLAPNTKGKKSKNTTT